MTSLTLKQENLIYKRFITLDISKAFLSFLNFASTQNLSVLYVNGNKEQAIGCVVKHNDAIAFIILADISEFTC